MGFCMVYGRFRQRGKLKAHASLCRGFVKFFQERIWVVISRIRRAGDMCDMVALVAVLGVLCRAAKVGTDGCSRPGLPRAGDKIHALSLLHSLAAAQGPPWVCILFFCVFVFWRFFGGASTKDSHSVACGCLGNLLRIQPHLRNKLYLVYIFHV